MYDIFRIKQIGPCLSQEPFENIKIIEGSYVACYLQ
jgi:hypothetical protein